MAEKTSTGGKTLYLRMQQVKDNNGGKSFGIFQYRKDAPTGGVPSTWFLANIAKPEGGYLVPHTITGQLYALTREDRKRILATQKEQEYFSLVAHLQQADGLIVNFEVGDLTYRQTEDFMLKLLCPEYTVEKPLYIDAYRNKNDYNTVVLRVDDQNGLRLDIREQSGDKWVDRSFLTDLPALNMVETANGRVADLVSQTARTKWIMGQLVVKFGPDFFKKKQAPQAAVSTHDIAEPTNYAESEKFPTKEPVRTQTDEDNARAEQQAPYDDLPF